MENDNTKDKRDRLRTLLLDINAEQMAEYYRFGVALEKFTYEIRCRFINKQLEGIKGWEDSNPETLGDGIEKAIHRLEGIGDIDLASWAFIYWFKKNKPLPTYKHYTIYLSPEDYPSKYVVMVWNVIPGKPEPIPDPKPLAVEANYHDAVSHIPLGTVKILPQEGDIESLLETWI